MEETNQAMQAIQNWQEWYRNHRVVAELNEPLMSKDSRETLHNTEKTFASVHEMLDYKSNKTAKEKAIDAFADTMAEFLGDLTADELYDALMTAAKQQKNFAEREYALSKAWIALLS